MHCIMGRRRQREASRHAASFRHRYLVFLLCSETKLPGKQQRGSAATKKKQLLTCRLSAAQSKLELLRGSASLDHRRSSSSCRDRKSRTETWPHQGAGGRQKQRDNEDMKISTLPSERQTLRTRGLQFDFHQTGLWRVLHSAIKGLQPPEHHAGKSVRIQVPPSQTNKNITISI